MFMLLAAVPALLFAWSLGGRFGGLIEQRWRHVWLIWAGLGAQLVLFTPLGNGIPPDVLKLAHVATYLPIVAFLALNHDAGLGIIAAGVALNLVAIGVNGGLMPADPVAQEVFFAGASDPGHPINTDSSAGRLLLFGDVMSLPAWFPYANAFSIGDVLLALGLCWALARLTLPRREVVIAPVSADDTRPLLSAAALRLGPWMAVGVAIGYAAAEGTSVAVVAVLAVLAGWLTCQRVPQHVALGLLCVAAVGVPLAGLMVGPTPRIAVLIASLSAGCLLGARTATDGRAQALVGVAAAALGLALGATLIAVAGLAGGLVATGVLIVVVAFVVDLLPGRDHGAALTRLVRVDAGTLALPAAGTFALGAAAMAASRHALPVALEAGRFGLVAAAIAIGGLCGFVMTAVLTDGPNGRALGVGLLFAGASLALAAAARNPMTLIAASVVLGLTVGGVAWLLRSSFAPGSAPAALVPLAVGVAAGACLPPGAAAAFIWSVAACAAIAAIVLLGRSFRTKVPHTEPITA